LETHSNENETNRLDLAVTSGIWCILMMSKWRKPKPETMLRNDDEVKRS